MGDHNAGMAGAGTGGLALRGLPPRFLVSGLKGPPALVKSGGSALGP